MAKLHGALIGFGNVAAYGHWPAYSESKDFEIVTVVDPSPERRKVAQQLRPDLTVFSSFEEFLQAKHKALDFVDICTPPTSHVKMAQECIRKGWHVLCEKPLALHAGDYTLLVRHVERAEKTVFTVHNWKYSPIFQKALQTIQQGRIGAVWHVELFVQRDSFCRGSAQGKPGTAAEEAEDWRTSREIAGGGILVDHGWHSFYLLLNAVGTAPERVVARMHADPEDSDALEDAVQALVQFPEADGYIHLTWRAKMRRNSIIIQGTKGTLLLDDDRLMLTTHDGKREETMFESALSAGSHHSDWFHTLLPDFLAEIRDPAKRGANFREAGWCVALTCAAYESNVRGFQEVAVTFPGTPKQAPVLA
jgi:predicted dehydrogenase